MAELDPNILFQSRTTGNVGAAIEGAKAGLQARNVFDEVQQRQQEAPVRLEILNELLAQRGQESEIRASGELRNVAAAERAAAAADRAEADAIARGERDAAAEARRVAEAARVEAARLKTEAKNEENRVLGSVASTYSGVKGLVDAGKFEEAAKALEANKAVLAKTGITNFEDTDIAIAALRSGDPAQINKIKLQGNEAIRIAKARGLFDLKGGKKFSATTVNLPGGLSIQTDTKGNKTVTDAAGTVLTGQNAIDAIEKAEKAGAQAKIDTAKGKKTAVLETEIELGGEATKVVEDAKNQAKIDAAAEVKEEGALGVSRGKIASTINEAAIEARRSRPEIAEVRQALDAIETGRFAQAKTILGPFIPGLDISNEEVMQSQITQFVLNTLNKQTGTKTDFDFKKASEASASLGKTTAANRAILDILLGNLDRAISEQDQFKTFRKGGGKSEDFKFVDQATEDRLNELRNRLGL